MKHQALFSSKDKCKKIKVSSAAILLDSLRVAALDPVVQSIISSTVLSKGFFKYSSTQSNMLVFFFF